MKTNTLLLLALAVPSSLVVVGCKSTPVINRVDLVPESRAPNGTTIPSTLLPNDTLTIPVGVAIAIQIQPHTDQEANNSDKVVATDTIVDNGTFVGAFARAQGHWVLFGRSVGVQPLTVNGQLPNGDGVTGMTFNVNVVDQVVQ